jgi:hypothetical protein
MNGNIQTGTNDNITNLKVGSKTINPTSVQAEEKHEKENIT